MRRAVLRSAALALMLLPAIARAEAVEEKNVLAGKAKRDPAKGYIFLSGAQRQTGMFLRVPDDETRAKWQADWEKAFAKAQKKYASAVVQWQSDMEIAKQTRAKPPERPVEPTRENFTIDPLDLRDAESFGPMFVYAKGERVSYLNAVKPGTWIWYGPMFLAPNGSAGGTCYCMGTVRFEVKAGTVADLGDMLAVLPKYGEQKDVTLALMSEKFAERVRAQQAELARGGVHHGLPASLNGWPVEVPKLEAAGKLNNYYGGMVSRLPPIEGVLAYKRDRVIDVPSGEEVPNGPIVSRQKKKL